jgi:glucose-1-phosphate cytidylyltransferase
MTKVLILAGGKGTRFSEKTIKKPKPLIEIGKNSLIWHIMNQYSNFNLTDFIVLAGYKYKEFYKEFKKSKYKNWNIKVLNTGLSTETGSRVLKAKKYLEKDTDSQYFYLTYGDGISNINIKNSLMLFKKKKKIGLVTTVRPPSRFGLIRSDSKNQVISFKEKFKKDKGWINAGFFIFDFKIFNFIENEKNSVLEKKPLEKLVKIKNLITYKHKGFWQCCDNKKDFDVLCDYFDKKKYN